MDGHIQKRRVVKQRATRLTNYVESLGDNENDEVELQVRLDKLEECMNQFNDIQDKIELHLGADNEEAQELERESFETKYFTTKAALINRIKQSTTQQLEVNQQTTLSNTAESKVKLPTLELPQFSGQYQDWFSFYDLFVALVHNNHALAPSQKLHYLKSTLRGEAARLLSSIQVTDANYQEAWEILVERYQNRRQIVQAHIKALFGQSHLTNESASGLRKLLDTTMENIRALHVLKEPTDHWGSILVHLVVERLDPDSRRQWELATPVTETPTFEELKKFLDQRCRALEASGVPKQKQFSTPVRPQAPFHNRQSTLSYHSTNRLLCGVCKADHVIYQCPRFLEATPTERSLMIKKNMLCFNCLRSSHTANMCKSITCKKCNRRHHTLLHPEHSISTGSHNTNAGPRVEQERFRTVTHSTSNLQTRDDILLLTALVQIPDVAGNYQLCRALIDSGSQSSFVTEACVQRLRLRKTAACFPINGIGNIRSDTTKGKVKIEVYSNQGAFAMTLDAFVIFRISGCLPSEVIHNQSWTHLSTLKLADPTYNMPADIDLLLGADVFAQLLLEGKIIGKVGEPSAQNTILGWVLSGKVTIPNSNEASHGIVSHLVLDANSDLKKFWELEEISQGRIQTREEIDCEKQYSSTYTRDENGRYTVRLPFKESRSDLGNSKKAAITRFLQFERSLSHTPSRQRQYLDFMEEYLTLGHMVPLEEGASVQSVDMSYYLPHHAVIKETSTTTKLRVVFDASAKTTSGTSLNDQLLVGPRLQCELVDIIMRFRMHKIAVTADIEKMFRQILIHNSDSDYQRIVWRRTTAVPISEFKLTTVTYGLASAPYLATRTLQQLARDEEGRFPIAAAVTLEDFYVDDLLSGSDDVTSALVLQTELIQLLESGGFHIRKWASNNVALLEKVDKMDQESQVSLGIDGEAAVKTLGLVWHPKEDYFSFSIHLPPEPVKITKRNILAEISRLFDPLGWLGPTIVIAKVLIQKLWLLSASWDEELPADIRKEWLKYREHLPMLGSIQIERWLSCLSSAPNYQLHGFCDASERAYGAVVYMRVLTPSNQVKVHLLTSKSKVAPIKQVSLPRLELCGATLLAQLMCKVIKVLSSPTAIFAWTDSTITLSWIGGYPNRWKTFVANRVTEIQGVLPPSVWHHVTSGDNPADCLSRGVQPNDLQQHPMWWIGVPWLELDQNQWPRSTWSTSKEAEREIRPIRTLIVSTPPIEDILERVSSLTKLKRVTAYCMRFIRNASSSKETRHIGPLTSVELNEALGIWIRIIQGTVFKNLIKSIKTNDLAVEPHLRQLAPFIDETGAIRVGGRLRHAQISYDSKHPLLLPKTHRLTTLIIDHEHSRQLHAGAQQVASSLQTRYWIIHGRDAIRRRLNSCITCFRLRAQPSVQFMGDLPPHRVEAARPFLHCGVDFGGPFSIKTAKGRGGKLQKAKAKAKFVCLSVKAVHLELVSDLSIDSFLNALKRFFARRGLCQNIYSDNATNFVGANKEIQRVVEAHIRTERVTDTLVNEGISWHFIPPSAPHFGGLWEVSIKSVKYHLRRIMGNTALTFEEMYTILTEIEACLNSRPLTALSNDPNDLTVLTPGHFLIGDSIKSIPEQDLTQLKINRLSRWQLVQQFTQHFWKRWRTEYLTRLQQRKKWNKETPNVKIGDLVLLKEDNLPRLKWKLARIIEVHPGADSHVRVVVVKTNDRILRRPIVKICPLPFCD